MLHMYLSKVINPEINGKLKCLSGIPEYSTELIVHVMNCPEVYSTLTKNKPVDLHLLGYLFTTLEYAKVKEDYPNVEKLRNYERLFAAKQELFAAAETSTLMYYQDYG